jgi:mRNA interferase RelE/StbE
VLRVRYEIEFKRRSVKDLKSVPANDHRQIVAKIEAMKDDLTGDVKRLTNFSPEYRLRVGDYRVLFELDGNKIMIYRIKHRKDAYS